jgi:hypothetical protein
LLRTLLQSSPVSELIHRAGFIHRDIKPGQHHIRGDGTPVVLDRIGRQALEIAKRSPFCRPAMHRSNSTTAIPRIRAVDNIWAGRDTATAPSPDVRSTPSRAAREFSVAQDVLVPASVIGAGRYSGGAGSDRYALAFSEKDRPDRCAMASGTRG